VENAVETESFEKAPVFSRMAILLEVMPDPPVICRKLST
jgi:hypothetical protein